jgi:molecular chaperone GrpE
LRLEKFANELLPVIDSLERALEVANKEDATAGLDD